MGAHYCFTYTPEVKNDGWKAYFQGQAVEKVASVFLNLQVLFKKKAKVSGFKRSQPNVKLFFCRLIGCALLPVKLP